MGGFTNTSHKMTMNSLVDGFKAKLDNPYYLFTDKKPTLVTYYNINSEKTTLDDASKQIYSPLGDDSPLHFNKIKDAYLFGIERMMTEVDIGDFGPEAGEIEGEAIVLPNSFIPYPDDYFSIDMLNKKNILFRVTKVTPDTLENGANFYKLSYHLDQYDKDIEKQVVDDYTMVVSNVGTQYNSILRTNDFDFIREMELITNKLKTYYYDLFYNTRVQTFTYKYGEDYFYDPYMIEFLIRNGILSNGEKYIYVSHQTFKYATFALDYDKTFFRTIELKKKPIKVKTAYASLVEDPNSLLVTRLEDYFKIDYSIVANALISPIPVVNMKLVEAINTNTLLTEDDQYKYFNIIIQYFNDGKIDSDTIDIIDSIDYNANIDLFYAVPIIIYILEDQIKRLLIKNNDA